MKKLIVALLSCALILSLGAGFVFAGEADQAAADEVQALIEAIQVQERTEETDAQCEAAKAAWDALTEEQEKVRASHPSPVLTLNAEAGSFEASNTANNAAAPSFSWSLLLVYLTAGFSVASVLLFLLSFVMRLITVRDSKRASRRASA